MLDCSPVVRSTPVVVQRVAGVQNTGFLALTWGVRSETGLSHNCTDTRARE